MCSIWALHKNLSCFGSGPITYLFGFATLIGHLADFSPRNQQMAPKAISAKKSLFHRTQSRAYNVLRSDAAKRHHGIRIKTAFA